MNKILEYSYLRSEADNKITLFIKGDSSFIDTDASIDIVDNKLKIIINEDTYSTDFLDELLLNHLLTEKTKIMIINDNAECLSKIDLPSLGKKTKNKML